MHGLATMTRAAGLASLRYEYAGGADTAAQYAGDDHPAGGDERRRTLADAAAHVEVAAFPWSPDRFRMRLSCENWAQAHTAAIAAAKPPLGAQALAARAKRAPSAAYAQLCSEQDTASAPTRAPPGAAAGDAAADARREEQLRREMRARQQELDELLRRREQRERAAVGRGGP